MECNVNWRQHDLDRAMDRNDDPYGTPDTPSREWPRRRAGSVEITVGCEHCKPGQSRYIVEMRWRDDSTYQRCLRCGVELGPAG